MGRCGLTRCLVSGIPRPEVGKVKGASNNHDEDDDDGCCQCYCTRTRPEAMNILTRCLHMTPVIMSSSQSSARSSFSGESNLPSASASCFFYHRHLLLPHYSEASKGGMKAGRIKDPLYKDYYLRISHLPSPHLLRPPNYVKVPQSSCKKPVNPKVPRTSTPQNET